MVSRGIVYNEDYTIWGHSTDNVKLIQARKDREIRCYCGKSLTFVDSKLRLPHFRHLKGNCKIIGAERDTETHNDGLEYLGQLLRKHFPRANIEKEKFFDVPKGLRRTDIFVDFNGERTICYELQCSPISEQEFLDRTIAYNILGHEVIWIFGQESSGIKNIPNTTSYEELLKGTPIAMKYLASSVIELKGYLILYYPKLKDKLWIAYCSDGNFNKKRNFTIKRGDLEQQLSMPEINLSFFPIQFDNQGVPYASRFPIEAIKRSYDRRTEKIKKIRSRYLRELQCHGIEPILKQSSKSRTNDHYETPTFVEKHEVKPKKKKRVFFNLSCTICGSSIKHQHYHLCSECKNILCDDCTIMIEKDLKITQHNLHGWVSHCNWIHLGKANVR